MINSESFNGLRLRGVDEPQSTVNPQDLWLTATKYTDHEDEAVMPERDSPSPSADLQSELSRNTAGSNTFAPATNDMIFLDPTSLDLSAAGPLKADETFYYQQGTLRVIMQDEETRIFASSAEVPFQFVSAIVKRDPFDRGRKKSLKLNDTVVKLSARCRPCTSNDTKCRRRDEDPYGSCQPCWKKSGEGSDCASDWAYTVLSIGA